MKYKIWWSEIVFFGWKLTKAFNGIVLSDQKQQTIKVQCNLVIPAKRLYFSKCTRSNLLKATSKWEYLKSLLQYIYFSDNSIITWLDVIKGMLEDYNAKYYCSSHSVAVLEKSLKNNFFGDYFQNCPLKSSFWDFSPKRLEQCRKKRAIFEHVPSIPLDRHPTCLW